MISNEKGVKVVQKMARNLLILLTILATASPLFAKEKFPETTKDGLKLQSQTRHGAVYVKDGASLAAYDKVKILDCFVQFEKDWQRNYNRDEAGLDGRVTDQDVERIKKWIADEFPKTFSKELEKGGYTVVNDNGPDVLLLRPAIINLDITAPDVMSPGMETTFAASAGSMTLYLELYDGKTQDIIARIIDPEAADDAGIAQIANRVTNTAQFDRVLRHWAKILNSHLAQVKK